MAKVSKRFYNIFSESEFFSLKNYGFVRNPRVSSDIDASDQQQFHDLARFSTVGDSASALFYIYSGTHRHPIDGSAIKAGRRAHINHLTLPSEESENYSRFKMNKVFTDLMILLARTSLFEISKSPSEVMQHHVLFLSSQNLANTMASSVRLNRKSSSSSEGALHWNSVAQCSHQATQMVTELHHHRDVHEPVTNGSLHGR